MLLYSMILIYLQVVCAFQTTEGNLSEQIHIGIMGSFVTVKCRVTFSASHNSNVSFVRGQTNNIAHSLSRAPRCYPSH